MLNLKDCGVRSLLSLHEHPKPSEASAPSIACSMTYMVKFTEADNAEPTMPIPNKQTTVGGFLPYLSHKKKELMFAISGGAFQNCVHLRIK